MTVMTVLPGGGEAPDITARPVLKAVHVHKPALPGFNDGEFVVCCRCSFTFDECGSSQDCPMCGAGAGWLEEHHHKSDRDERAAKIDPARVADQISYQRRVIRDRERRRLTEGSAA